MPGDLSDRDELLRLFEAAVSGQELSDLRELAGDLGPQAGPIPERPSLRRPRRDAVSVYRLRVDLDGARPPIWRRLDVRSHVMLDVLHQVLQAAYSWTDSHLHRFALGGGPFDRHTEWFLCPYDVAEGEDPGSPASAVRLDETLQEPGDVLRYVYDYGDSWELTLRLEEVLPAGPDTPAATCLDGRRAAPPEDCGGITDAADLAEVLTDPAHFDMDAANQALRDPYFLLREEGVNPRLVELVNALRFTDFGADLATRLLVLAASGPGPTPAEIEAALRAHLWFLDRAAGDGIVLTPAGYLKPADVEIVAQLVPALGQWIGKVNRESLTAPLLNFRQSLQAMGLLRKHQGRLVLTRAGAKARGNPRVLWEHLAARLAPSSDTDTFDAHATFLVLACAATSTDGTVPLRRIADALERLGWRRSDRQPLAFYDLYRLRGTPLAVLQNVSDEPVPFGERDWLSPVAIALARAALRAPSTG